MCVRLFFFLSSCYVCDASCRRFAYLLSVRIHACHVLWLITKKIQSFFRLYSNWSSHCEDKHFRHRSSSLSSAQYILHNFQAKKRFAFNFNKCYSTSIRSHLNRSTRKKRLLTMESKVASFFYTFAINTMRMEGCKIEVKSIKMTRKSHDWFGGIWRRKNENTR